MSDILIKEESVQIVASGKTIDYYTPILGRRPSYREIIRVPVSTLPPSSNMMVTAVCPQCGKERVTRYYAITRENHTFCQPCRQRQAAYGQYIGQKIGRLTITGFAGTVDTGEGGNRTILAAVCECGNETTIWAQSVRDSEINGRVLSCGCYNKERAQELGHNNAGANNGMFRHDLSLEERVNRRKLLKHVKSTWGRRIRRRDKECVVCGTTEITTSHHLYSVRHKPELCLDDRNGVVLCTQHHEEFHCQFMGHVHAYTSPGDFYAYLQQVHGWSETQIEQLITSKNLLR